MCEKETETEEVEEWVKEFINMPKAEWERFIEEMDEAINSERRTSSPKKPKTTKSAQNMAHNSLK